jgi:hypothetical protein
MLNVMMTHMSSIGCRMACLRALPLACALKIQQDTNDIHYIIHYSACSSQPGVGT